MRDRRIRLRAATLLAVTALTAASLVFSAPARAASDDRSHVGRSYVFDYGEMVIRVRYLSASRLGWEQVKGPQPGLKAEEEYGSAAVREGVVFFWWQEKDTGVVTQVVDFDKGVVHSTWTSPEKKLAGFSGKVKRLE